MSCAMASRRQYTTEEVLDYLEKRRDFGLDKGDDFGLDESDSEDKEEFDGPGVIPLYLNLISVINIVF